MQRLAAVLLGCLMALTVVEASVRVFAPSPPLLYWPDASLGWVHPPHLACTYPGRNGPTAVQFNSRGLRDAERATEKPPGVFRVLVLGDSYAEGVDVEQAQTFAAHLERLLRASGRPAEVINTGVGGYGTDQEYMYLTREGWGYAPDLVLLAFTVGNDVHDNLMKGYCRSTATGVVCVPPGRGRLRRIVVSAKAFLQRHLHSYFFIRQKTAQCYPVRRLLSGLGLTEFQDSDDVRNVLPVDLRMLLRDAPPDLDRGWQLTTAILAGMRQDAAAHGARLAIAVIPEEFQVADAQLQPALRRYGLDPSQLDLGRPTRMLQMFGSAHGVPVVDLLPVFRAAVSRGGRLSNGHWNAAGHLLAAETIYRELAMAGLFGRK